MTSLRPVFGLRTCAAMVALVMECGCLCARASQAQGPPTRPLKLIETIPLEAHGPLGHMIIDRVHDRAFVADTAQSAVDVIDLKTAKSVGSIAGPGAPVELVYFKKCDCVAYSSGAGVLRIVNANTLSVDAEFAFAGAAGALSLDPQHASVYVVHQPEHGRDADAAHVSVYDLVAHRKLAEISIPGGRLGQMVMEHHGPRGYINNTAAHEVIVVDLDARKVVDRWKLDAGDNVAVALDEANHRLLVGSQTPAMLTVINTQTGLAVAHLPTVGNVEDISYDATLQRVYLSGSGSVDVVQQNGPDAYQKIVSVATDAGAGKSKWAPEQNRLYVEVPSRTSSETGGILVFEALK